MIEFLCMQPKVLILAGHGINCEDETARAFENADFSANLCHVEDFCERADALLKEVQVLVFPGGFSFGDHLGAGVAAAGMLRGSALEAISAFLSRPNSLALGICNGFQVMASLGIVPSGAALNPQVALEKNANQKPYLCRWVPVKAEGKSACIWTRDLPKDASFDLPIAHGEGRFVAQQAVLDQLEHSNCVALRYADSGENSPNGSARDIAGICDPSGRFFGLMPHPERALDPHSHPLWPRQFAADSLPDVGIGQQMFMSARRAVR